MQGDVVPLELTPMQMLTQMVQSGVDVEKMKGMMDLAERWEAKEAAKAHAAAIHAFQGKCPAIIKDNPVRGKNTPDGNPGPIHYYFAGFDDIMEVIQPILTECGIGVTFNTVAENGFMTTTCHVRVGAHVEDTSVKLALPQIPNANDTQKAGGAIKFGMRYALVAALNIRVKGEDNDANSLSEFISEEQIKILENQINDIHMCGGNVDRKAFFKLLEVESLRELPKDKFVKAVAALDNKARQIKEKAK